MVGSFVLLLPRTDPHLWTADQVRNDGAELVLSCCCLTFDSSPIKGEGIWLVVLSCCCPARTLTSGLRIKSAMTGRSWYCLVVASHHTLPLWIDESPMNLCEILGFQLKGVNALSFSSR